MKRTFSGLSLRRPPSKSSSANSQLDPGSGSAPDAATNASLTPPLSDDSSSQSSATNSLDAMEKDASKMDAPPAPTENADMAQDIMPPPSALAQSMTLPAPVDLAPPLTSAVKPSILKKTPSIKSPNPKKVEFVKMSDDEDFLSDVPPSSGEDDEELIENPRTPTTTTTTVVTKKQVQVIIPSSAKNRSPPTKAKDTLLDKPMVLASVSKKMPLQRQMAAIPSPSFASTTSSKVNDMEVDAVEDSTTTPKDKSVRDSVKPAHSRQHYPKEDMSEEDEDDYNDENDGGTDDDSDSNAYKPSSKRSKKSNTTLSIQSSIQARKTVTRTTRSGRTPLSTLSVSISSKPLLAAKSQPTQRSVATLGRKFKIPTFTKLPAGGIADIRPSPHLTLGVKRRMPVEASAAFDYTMEGAIILYDPAWEQLDEAQKEEEAMLKNASQEGGNGEEVPQVIIPTKPKAKSKSIAEMLGLVKPKEAPKVHVVVDPVLGRILRPHQVEGVKFMYKCTTGLVQSNAFGCIMADEMGLGKTLQCLTLLWTLLKQSPVAGKGTIEKGIICCPSSLVRNWANEIIKWLGPGKIGVLTCDAKGTKEDTNNAMKAWAAARGRMVVNPVLIISYESLRMYAPVLAQTPIGLMLCDEGHRLKNSNSQTFVALNELNVQRRVILSGTPIQNDLSEYFSLINFSIPGLLGSTVEFRKNYELPILRGRDADASDKEQELSNQKLGELSGVVSKFIIRRTNDILTKYLPTKFEHVVFCRLSPMQLDLYNHFINSKSIQKLLRGVGSQPLKAIGLLKKLCNHPDLLDLPDDLEGCEHLLPPEYQLKMDKRGTSSRGGGMLVQPEFSGKMLLLARMLAKIKKETNDKIVLISNYTQTLDIFEKLCRQNGYGVLRLDGTMTINKRQKLVDRFNNPDGGEFVFLLSSKAGGCGLNLIGANRLILFDPDWNPAADQQALARVWRDGQKKDCFVYRFIATGSIEEKIFQRQSHKQSLSSCVVDENEDVERHFSQENLRQLFQFNADTECCDTHETFKCKRCVDGRQVEKAAQVSYGDTSTWNHFKGDQDLEKLTDPLLKAEADSGAISFVFQYISH
ncbi:DNA-dependent ATPase protein rad54 [Actinomortierella ambigua]|nr:DNA-dependent ATPase protein rad54 [Actinomortierella ambigua]